MEHHHRRVRQDRHARASCIVVAEQEVAVAADEIHRHAGVAQHLEMVVDGGSAECGGGDDLGDVEALSRFECQEDALPLFVAKRDEQFGGAAPFVGNGMNAVRQHMTK